MSVRAANFVFTSKWAPRNTSSVGPELVPEQGFEPRTLRLTAASKGNSTGHLQRSIAAASSTVGMCSNVGSANQIKCPIRGM
jgi:hypothetical protein